MGVTGRHARRVQGAAWWGLRLAACCVVAGAVTGTAITGVLAAVLEDSSERVKTLPVSAFIDVQ